MNALLNFNGVLNHAAHNPLRKYVSRDKIEVTEFIELYNELNNYEFLDGYGQADLEELHRLFNELSQNTERHENTIEWEGEWYPEFLYSDEGVMDLIWEKFKTECLKIDDFPTWIEIDWEAALHMYTRKFGFKEIFIGTQKFWFKGE